MGIARLGYVVLQMKDPDAWAGFAETKVLPRQVKAPRRHLDKIGWQFLPAHATPSTKSATGVQNGVAALVRSHRVVSSLVATPPDACIKDRLKFSTVRFKKRSLHFGVTYLETGVGIKGNYRGWRS